MRILHLSALYPPHVVGGAEKSVELLARSQLALGHHVAASCLARHAEDPHLRDGVLVYRMAHSNSYWLEDWPLHSRAGRNWHKLRQQWNTVIEHRFGEVIDSFRPDIVHTHSLVDISPRVWRAAGLRGVAVVHTLRDYALVCANAAMFRRGANCASLHAKCIALSAASWFMQRHVRAVAGVSEDILQRHLQARLFRHIPEARRKVIWNGVAAMKGDPKRSSGECVFGYLGRINPEKGVATLLEACRLLPHTGWRLDIAGEAPGGTESFRQMAKALPVRFLGFADAAQFLSGIDVLVVPSIWAEPLPRTVLEAYAQGVPVIGARSGGIPELVGPHNSGWLFDSGDAAMLAARMTGAMARPRESLPGRTEFSAVLAEAEPRNVARKYLRLYEAATGDGPN